MSQLQCILDSFVLTTLCLEPYNCRSSLVYSSNSILMTLYWPFCITCLSLKSNFCLKTRIFWVITWRINAARILHGIDVTVATGQRKQLNMLPTPSASPWIFKWNLFRRVVTWAPAAICIIICVPLLLRTFVFDQNGFDEIQRTDNIQYLTDIRVSSYCFACRRILKMFCDVNLSIVWLIDCTYYYESDYCCHHFLVANGSKSAKKEFRLSGQTAAMPRYNLYSIK